MSITHLLLVLLVIVIWGINFIFVKIGLGELPPLLFCALRFLLASIPLIFFIKPPAIPFRMVALYGLIMFALQFALVFSGMSAGMTAGMTSVIIQVQVFFSMLFAALWIGERPTFWQMLGALVSFMGIGLVALHFDQHNISLLGFILVIAAAATWGAGNLITKKIPHANMLSLVAWGSFVAFFPIALMSIWVEGWDTILQSYHHLSLEGFFSVLYVVYLSTWVGYGVWGWLMRHHPVSSVAPFTLLIPMIGMLGSAWFLGEVISPWKIHAAILVILGLCINLLGARLFMKKNLVPQN